VNQIARRSPEPARTVGGVALPPATPWLREALAHVADPHPDIGLEPDRIRPGVREEARRHAAALEPLLRVATAEEWATFLRPLAALANGPTREAFPARASAIAFALNDVPGSVLTVDRQREAMRTLRFWPTPHDLDRILRPAVTALQRERRLLEAVATAPAVDQREAASPEDRERIGAGLADLAAELSGRSAIARGAALKPDRPRHLSDGALLAAYEHMVAEGGPNAAAAAVRVQALRAKMGDE